jgi:hypothetical protein
MGEDILWAKEVLEAGYAIRHEPDSIVQHSHAYSNLDLLRRNVDDGFANREIVGRQLDDDAVAPLIETLVRDDWRYLEQECRLSQEELDRWRLVATLRRTAQVVGQWVGVNHDHLPADLMTWLSLTERVKAGATIGSVDRRAD